MGGSIVGEVVNRGAVLGGLLYLVIIHTTYIYITCGPMQQEYTLLAHHRLNLATVYYKGAGCSLQRSRVFITKEHVRTHSAMTCSLLPTGTVLPYCITCNPKYQAHSTFSRAGLYYVQQ